MSISNRKSFFAHPCKTCQLSCAASLLSAATASASQRALFSFSFSSTRVVGSFSWSDRALSSFNFCSACACQRRLAARSWSCRTAFGTGRSMGPLSEPGWKAVRRQEALQPKNYGKQSEGIDIDIDIDIDTEALEAI